MITLHRPGGSTPSVLWTVEEVQDVGAEGRWFGQGAARLELAGPVEACDANAVFTGVDPRTGEALGERWRRFKAPGRSPRCGWEMSASPVKSYAILRGLADDAGRARLDAAEAKAFASVFARIEREAVTRLRTDRAAVVLAPAELIAAVMTGHRSRAGDPGFHRRLLISAKVWCDGRWLALDARGLHQRTVLYSVLYTALLEREVSAELGITAADRPGSVRADRRPVREFRGVPDSAITGFSTRRAAAQRQISALEQNYALLRQHEPSRLVRYKLAQDAAYVERPPRAAVPAENDRAAWRRRAEAYGIEDPAGIIARAQAASAAASAGPSADLPDLPGRVVAELDRHRAAFTDHAAEAEAVRQLAATGWHLAADDFPVLAREIAQAAAALRGPAPGTRTKEHQP